MNWEEAIGRFAVHKAMMARKRDPTKVKESTENKLKSLLNRIPKLHSIRIEEITPEIWQMTINAHKEQEGMIWMDIGNRSRGFRGVYKDLARCLVFAQNDYTCRYCGRSSRLKPHLQLHMDHIRPKSEWGEWFSLNNLGCSCAFCNYAKQRFTEEEYIDNLLEVAKSVLAKYPKKI